jgi:hypothetical protein
MTSINDATPEEWDAIANKFNKYETDGQESREAKRRMKQIEKVNGKLDTYNNVNHPSHYNQGTLECIDAIEAMLSVEEYIGYLNKAQWYEKRLTKFMEAHDVLGQKD